MSGYWLTMTPIVDPNTDAKEYVAESKKQYRVRYSTPGLGFACDEEVNGDVAALIKVAIEEGKRQKAEEIRAALGIR